MNGGKDIECNVLLQLSLIERILLNKGAVCSPVGRSLCLRCQPLVDTYSRSNETVPSRCQSAAHSSRQFRRKKCRNPCFRLFSELVRRFCVFLAGCIDLPSRSCFRLLYGREQSTALAFHLTQPRPQPTAACSENRGDGDCNVPISLKLSNPYLQCRVIRCRTIRSLCVHVVFSIL